MEGKKQETASNDEGEKGEQQQRRSRGCYAKREEARCQAAKEEFLGLKLRRRVTTGGAHTPVPAWRTEAEVDLMAGDEARRSGVSVSARKLGASLWEIQNLETRNSKGRRGSGTHCQRQGKGLEDDSAMDDRPNSSASLRRHMAASLVENRRIKERTSQAPLPESPASYSSSIGAASCSSEMIKPTHRDPRYGLKTSTELLKVLNRIWALEEQQTSHVSLVKSLKLELHQAHTRIKEMEGLLVKVSDEKSIKRAKEKEKIKHVVQSVKEELEEERKLRKNSENLQRKLGKDLGELKGVFLKAIKDLEKEKRVNSLLEDLCDEFARGIRDFEEEIRVLKQGFNNVNNNKDYGHKFDRAILHIAEAWLDERMQMQLAEKRGDLIQKNAIFERISGEIKSFLHEKEEASCSKNEENAISGKNGNFRRQSLESVHLNGNTSAPRVLEEDEEDSIASDLHCFELDMNSNGTEKRGRYQKHSKNGKEKLEFNLEKMFPRKTCFEDSPKTDSCEFIGNKIGNRDSILAKYESKKSSGETNFLNSIGQFCENNNSGDLCDNNSEISEFSPELPPGVRENTLKAKLIQARLEGRQVRLRGSLSGGVRK
ncbi:hypothetical protein LUZ60_012538 [Juncus effusus]|nr:hypothetical protein LUZ60_012538 [Juncus effusus]